MAQWIESIVRARFLVACLGEYARPPWWHSQATSLASRRMLERIYPRTYLAASVDAAGRAAAIVHDAHIGRIGTYHLFRLHTADETAIHELLQQPEGTDVLRSVAALDDADQQLRALADLASSALAPGTQGPIRCGHVDELHNQRTLQRVCAAYVQGFRNGTPVYAYLDHEAL